MLKETGEHHFVRLEVSKLIVNRNPADATGPFRPYVVLRLPAEVALRTGKRQVNGRAVPDRGRQAPRLLRTALRASDRTREPGLLDLPKDARGPESLNRRIEDSLYRHHRARSVGRGAPTATCSVLRD